ncbi:MAG: AAA family ATPase, partial [Pseudomonadota bacterium]
QPELHLHPKAQFKLANIINTAVNRGVKVIIETHVEK